MKDETDSRIARLVVATRDREDGMGRWRDGDFEGKDVGRVEARNGTVGIVVQQSSGLGTGG